MAIQFSIDRLLVDAPQDWMGRTDMFRHLLETAMQQELQAVLQDGTIQELEALRLDIPPITFDDIYDMQETTHEIARRIVAALRRPSSQVSDSS